MVFGAYDPPRCRSGGIGRRGGFKIRWPKGLGGSSPPSGIFSNNTPELERNPNMTDEQPQQQQVQLRIDESKMTSTYANTIRSSNTQDEMIMDFGMNIPMQAPNQAPTIVFNVGSRVIMNWAGAKRLAMSLGQAIRQYEEINGEININPPRPQAPANDN